MLTCFDLHTYTHAQKQHTHPFAHRRANTHTHTLENRDTHTHRCWHTVTRTHTNAQRAQVSSHPPLVRALTFFHHRRIPQMMYLRHLAALAVFMGTAIQRL